LVFRHSTLALSYTTQIIANLFLLSAVDTTPLPIESCNAAHQTGQLRSTLTSNTDSLENMAYCSDFNIPPYELFDRTVNDWNEEITFVPLGVDAHKHQRYPYDGYHSLVQAPSCQLSDTSTLPRDSHLMGPDVCRPYYGSLPALYDSSSSSSSRPSPPMDSPASSFLRTPELYHRDVLFPSPGMDSYTPDYSMPTTGSCVTMQNVQRCADAQFEEPMDDFNIYETVFEPQELVLATREDDEPSSSTPYYHHHHQIPIANAETNQNTTRADLKAEPAPEQTQALSTRHSDRPRRPAKASPLPIIHSSKVTKRSSLRNLTSSQRKQIKPQIKSIKEEDDDEDEASTPFRSFPCPLAPYGCTSSFSAKNEWKRHATTQHFRLGFWRCDMCLPENKPINSHRKRDNNNNNNRKSAPNNTPNDFNRKDLFVQHVRRMHPNSISPDPTTSTTKSNINIAKKNRNSSYRKLSLPKTPATAASNTSLSQIATRCHRLTHSSPPPCCLCVFCGERFAEDGAEGLESALEHMGKHMDSRRKAGLGPVATGEWRADKGLEEWMLESGILGRGTGGKLVVMGSL